MMSKPAYLSVEIVTDKPTPGKISIPQVVSVAEQTGLSLTWSQTQYYFNLLVHQLYTLSDISRCLLSADFLYY